MSKRKKPISIGSIGAKYGKLIAPYFAELLDLGMKKRKKPVLIRK